ncbi:MAG: hypothetical protein DLM60_21820 [Pseudonocardiales bacterium]|nr:MAG: hypothetical protein DLM60_21820 [Pseudonocardiales bacterium]
MYADQATEVVWEQLRATRCNPPVGAATTNERRATYVFALEQAEQMFRAAATVGQATRPLLVFYGLSQAGRAIAAAASGMDCGDAWKLNGHGIGSLGLDRHLPDVEVRTGKQGERGSFVRLSELLDSPLWGKTPVRLNELWNLLPENEQSPLLDTGDLRRTPLRIDHRNLYPEPHPLASVPVVRFPPWVVNAGNGREALSKYLKAFPEAQGYYDFLRVDREPDANPNFTRHHDGWGELHMRWRLPDGQPGTAAERLALLETITRPYKGTLYFFPVVTPNTRSLHPLMAWWAILHTLSMLARYQPAEWASHINVDTSRHAVAIERLLKEAIRVLPKLVLETIDQITR